MWMGLSVNTATSVLVCLLLLDMGLWERTVLASALNDRGQPPHVILILADDMGWNDVGFHGSDQIPTPNIDALAFNGLILNQHYSVSLCTPSRAALLTGKYPFHTGMQHDVILESQPWGLGLNELTLPEALNRAGYKSHAIGKWHLGFFKKEYTPTFRGFQSHFGYWQGFQDYYNHSVRATFLPYDGYDMRRNMEVDWSAKGHYSTDLFTEEAIRIVNSHDASSPLFLYLAHLAPHTGNMREPFQAPDEAVAKFSHIKDPERRVYAAMVSKLDDSVGEIVAALKSRNMLQNSVVIFMSDNGAPTHGIHSNRGSNYPLRGIKHSAWEGGNRNLAAVWSPLLRKPQRIANQLMHITDWMPTLYALAGLNASELGNIDGMDMWSSLSLDKPSPRNELVYNIDEIGENPYAALRRGDWKYVTGSANGEEDNGWFGETGRNAGIAYSPRSVLLSKAGVAISTYVIREQIQDKINRAEGITRSIPVPELLDYEKILRLRADAEVECPVGNATTYYGSTACRPVESPCLFNLREDPCERVNLANRNKMIMLSLEEALQRYRRTVVKPRNTDDDEMADPALWNGTWTTWRDEPERFNFLPNLPDYLVALAYVTAVFTFILALIMSFPKCFGSMAGGKEKSTKVTPSMSVFSLSSFKNEKLGKD